jgi:hypothetical protein
LTVGAVADAGKHESETPTVISWSVTVSFHLSSSKVVAASAARIVWSSESWEPTHMPIYGLVRQEAVFSPEEVSAITTAFEAALQSLGLANRADPVAETVARKIIDLARMGERDPDRLCDQVLMTYGQSARHAG